MAKDSISFAWPSGKPCEKVKGKNGKYRSPRIDIDAPELGLLYRVTSVLNIIHSHGLDIYKEDQVIKATREWSDFSAYASYEFSAGVPELEDDSIKWIKNKAKQHVRECAKRGSEIHNHIQSWITDIVVPEDIASRHIIEHLSNFVYDHNLGKFQSEVNFAVPEWGYSGTADIVCENKDELWILDLKTTDLTDKYIDKDLKMKYKLQMAAYHKMNRHLNPHKKQIRCASIVADRNTGELYKDDFIYYTEEEMEDGMIAWEHLFNFFCIWRGYDPRGIHNV